MYQSKYTQELLEKAVLESTSFAWVCRYFGKVAKWWTYELIKNKIIYYKIDTSHFLWKKSLCWKNNPNYWRRISKEEILTQWKEFRVSHTKLKRALLESWILYKCFWCWINQWLWKEITLDVDHIDWDWSNCVISNLRFMCPNCHRQTDTFWRRNTRSTEGCGA